MKKLLLTLEYPPQKGGVAVYLENLVRLFPSRDIEVLAMSDSEAAEFDAKAQYTITRRPLLSRTFWPRWLKTYFITKRLTKLGQVDHIIISHLLPMGYVAMALRLPYTVIIHGMDVLSASQSVWKRFWARIIMDKASLIIANSHFSKEQVIALGIPASKIEVAHPCPRNLLSMHFDVERLEMFLDKFNLKGKKVLLSVNRLVSRKGNDTVINLMPEILRQVPDARYLIIGNGAYQSELESLIVKNGLHDKVQILNSVSDDDLAYFYRMAKIFVMPARHQNGNDVEGFGIVFLEAALFNLSSVSTYSGGIPEAIVDNVTGALVEEGDVDNLKNVIINILKNEEVRNRLGGAAKTRVMDEFRWEKQFSKVIEKLK